jgi:predicted enzyme related to lactoylglutathione lyase
MSQRDRYPHGVPCFVETLTSDMEAAQRFYTRIFGWEFAGPGPMPGDPPGQYYVAQLRGRDVAGLGSPPAGGSAGPAAWNTQVSVRSADEAAKLAPTAGGSVLVAPFDAAPAGRLAVLADPSGAVICVWEPGERDGAALVNEPSAWAMSVLGTEDPDAAQTFYGELFGWRAEAFDAGPGIELWFWRLPGFVGGEPEQPVPRDVVAAMTRTEPSAGPEPPSPRWSVDFWISDAEAAAAAAPGLGGAVMTAPFELASFRRAILADPSGAAFSVSQLLLGA